MLGHRALLASHRAFQAGRLLRWIDSTSPSASSRSTYSESSAAEPPALKTKLRELYKRVHPDLFHDLPLARDSNEHSFKLLQVPQTCFDVTSLCALARLWSLVKPAGMRRSTWMRPGREAR